MKSPDTETQQTTKNKETKEFLTDARRKILKSVLIIGAAIAIGVLIYPFFMDALNDAHQVTTIGGYEKATTSMTADDMYRMKKEAYAYNKQVYEEQQHDVYAYQGENYDDDAYDEALSPLDGSGVMAHIEIPVLNIYLPITHGTHSEDLKYMVGHMQGTSLPIGGTSTHCVLAGHTGLQNADLFTYIDRMQVGDQFYIHVLDEIHVYTVDQIKVVLPSEEVPYIQIEDNEDYITLFTCTPYGINDHRLLVRGTRTYPDLVYETPEGTIEDIDFRNILAWYAMLCMGSVPFTFAGIGLWLVNRARDITAIL